MADPKDPATPDDAAAASQPNPYVEQPAATPVTPAAPVPGAQQPYAYAAPGPAKGLSLTAMILGIAGVTLALCYGSGFLVALAGAIVGHIAAKRQPYAKPMWLTGIITGWAGVAISLLWLVGIILSFLIFGGSMWGLSTMDYYNY